MTAVRPGGSNTYIPSTEATNNLIVDFSRNVNDFALNRYCQIVPVTKDVGRYIKMTVEEAGRLLNDADDIWQDGDDAPHFRGETESFEFLPYETTRRAKGFRIGAKAASQAAWDILAQHGRIKAQRMMTRRTAVVIGEATTSGNYDSAHTSAVSSITGNSGKWDVSTTARQDIRRSLRVGRDQIRKSTLGAVKLDEIKLVMSPGCAGKIAECQEIVDYLKGSPQALSYIKGNEGPNAQYGLPDKLYGTEIVVEDAVKVTSKKGATKVTSYVLGDDTPFLCSRPGGLVSEGGSENPRFSTICLFMYEEMTVESKHDVDNRVNKGRVVEDYACEMTAAIAGYLFTAAVSTS